MPEIIIAEPMGNVIDRRQFDAGITFAQAVMTTWPKAFPDNQVRIFGPDGNRLDDESAVLNEMKADEVYRIVLYPNGPTILGVQLGMWILAGVSLAASVLLAPKIPKLGDYGNYEWEDEARPQFLSGQTNAMTPGSRLPDIFGNIRVYPNLITRSVIEYYGDYQSIRELFAVTNGYADCSDFRLQDNFLDDLPAYGVTEYFPGDDWPINFPIIRENDYVGQVELPAPNETTVVVPSWTLNTSGTITVPVDGYFSPFTSRVGQVFYIFSTGFNPANNKLYTLTAVSVDGRTITVSPAPSVTQTVASPRVIIRQVTAVWGTPAAPNTFTPANWSEQWPVSGNFTGYTATPEIPAGSGLGSFLADVTSKMLNPATGQEFTVKRITTRRTAPGGIFEETGQWIYHSRYSPQPPVGVPYIFVRMENPVPPYNPDVPNTGYNSPVFNVPGSNTKEIWFDFEFPQGLYYQTSGQPPQARAVTVNVFYRAAGSNDPWIQHPGGFTFSGTTRNPRRWTSKILGLTPGAYEIYVGRLTNTVLETSTVFVQDSIRLIGLKGVQDTPELENLPIEYTMLELAFYTQNLSQALTNRQFNCIAQRFLPDHRTGDGSNLISTRSIADAILYTLIDQEFYDKANIDLANLIDIQDYLDSLGSGMGEFNGIIDQAMTTEDQVVTIANVGNIMVYRKSRDIFFRRPKSDDLPITLFNSRNKTQPEQKTMMFGEVNDPDAIIVRFLNEVDNFNETEVQYPNDIIAIRPKTVNVLGLTNLGAAYRRAKLEWDRMIYQKDSVVITSTEEGILVGPGDVIANADSLLTTRPIEGEIVSVNADQFIFDRVIPAGTYIGRIRDEYGALLFQSDVTIASDGRTQTIPAWAGAVMPGAYSTVGLLYQFVDPNDVGQDLYLVTNVDPNADGSVIITGLRYADEIYSSDQTPIPNDLVIS